MRKSIPRDLPSWEKTYRDGAMEKMPWFFAHLDPDLEAALDDLGLEGGKVLDLGSGPGTQAIELAKRGFEATGTDISKHAVEYAGRRAEQERVKVSFLQDDFLDTRLTGAFDVVFDRGMLHALEESQQRRYVEVISRLVHRDGWLLLKCFSFREPPRPGPYRFRPEEIRDLLGESFEVISIEDTVYQGTLDPLPKALFCRMRKK